MINDSFSMIFAVHITVKVTLCYYKNKSRILIYFWLQYNNLENKADPQQVVTECHSLAYRTLVHKTSSTFG